MARERERRDWEAAAQEEIAAAELREQERERRNQVRCGRQGEAVLSFLLSPLHVGPKIVVRSGISSSRGVWVGGRAGNG